MTKRKPAKQVQTDNGIVVWDHDTKLTRKRLRKMEKQALKAFRCGEVAPLLKLVYLISRAKKLERRSNKEHVRMFDPSDEKRSCMKLADAVLHTNRKDGLAPLLKRERACLAFLRLYAGAMEGIIEAPITGKRIGLAAIPAFGNVAELVLTLLIFIVVPRIISCPISVLNRVLAEWIWGSALNFIPGYAMVRRKTPPLTFMVQTFIAYLLLRRHLAVSEPQQRGQDFMTSYTLEVYFGHPVEYDPYLQKQIVGDTRPNRRDNNNYASGV